LAQAPDIRNRIRRRIRRRGAVCVDAIEKSVGVILRRATRRGSVCVIGLRDPSARDEAWTA
jgi:hypothetical protein